MSKTPKTPKNKPEKYKRADNGQFTTKEFAEKNPEIVYKLGAKKKKL